MLAVFCMVVGLSAQNNHSVTVVNNGGGYVWYSGTNVENWYPLSNTDTWSGVDEGFQLYLESFTISPVCSAYNPDEYPGTRLKEIWIDGVQVPLDGSDARVVVEDHMAHSGSNYGYILYDLVIDFDTDHVVEFVHGSYFDESVCEGVQGLSAYEKGDTWATLNWVPTANGATAFDVSFSFSGSEQAQTGTPTVGNDGYWHCELTGLEPMTEYTVTVAYSCADSSTVSMAYTFTTYGQQHNVYISNSDGGWMQYRRLDNNTFTPVDSAAAVAIYEGGEVLLLRMLTDQGIGLSAEEAKVFQSLIVNGQEVPMEDIEAHQQEGYIMYLYYITDLTQDYVVEAHFGPEVCEAPTGLIWGNATGNSFAVAWNVSEGEGVMYYLNIYRDGQEIFVDSVVDGGFYQFDGLEAYTDYDVTVSRQCPDGLMTSTIATYTLGETLYNISLSNEGGGLVTALNNTNTRFFADTVLQNYEGAWLNLRLYSFDAATNESTYGWENYQLQHLYIDDQEVTLATDSSQNDTYSLVEYDFMEEYGYKIYVLSICFNSDHSVRVVYGTDSSYVPETHTITVVNHGRGYMDDQMSDGYGFFTQDTNVLVGGRYNWISLRIVSMGGDQAGQYGFNDEGGRLVSLVIDGEVIALDGSDSRLSISDNGYEIYYAWEEAIYFDMDHTIEAWFEPWDGVPSEYTVTIGSNDYSLGYIVGANTYAAGSTAFVYALPQGGVTFVGWAESMDGNIISTENPMSFTVNSDRMLYCIFSICSGGTVYDTVTNTVYDTVTNTVYDTVTNTVYDTVTNTVYDTVTNTVYDTVTNTVYDTVTNTVVDTVDNYIYDTIYADTLWLTVHDTVWIYDTIYVGEEGIDDVDTVSATVYISQGQIVVEGAEGNQVVLYDAVGRVLAVRRSDEALWGIPLRFDVPATGTYLIRVGHAPARRIVVVK